MDDIERKRLEGRLDALQREFAGYNNLMQQTAGKISEVRAMLGHTPAAEATAPAEEEGVAAAARAIARRRRR